MELINMYLQARTHNKKKKGARYNTEEQPVKDKTPSHPKSDLLKVLTHVKIN